MWLWRGSIVWFRGRCQVGTVGFDRYHLLGCRGWNRLDIGRGSCRVGSRDCIVGMSSVVGSRSWPGGMLVWGSIDPRMFVESNRVCI